MYTDGKEMKTSQTRVRTGTRYAKLRHVIQIFEEKYSGLEFGHL